MIFFGILRISLGDGSIATVDDRWQVAHGPMIPRSGMANGPGMFGCGTKKGGAIGKP